LLSDISHHDVHPCRHRAAERAFTLLELLVVCILLSIMLAFSIPAFRSNLVSDPLREAARKITGVLREARHEAALSRDGCFLIVELSEDRIGYECPEFEKGETIIAEKKQTSHMMELPSDIRFDSLWEGSDNSTAGRIAVWINQNGQMDQTIINITDGDRYMALVTSVFLNDIRIEEEVFSPEDIDRE